VVTSGVIPPEGAPYLVLGNPSDQPRNATVTSLETGAVTTVSVPALGTSLVGITGTSSVSSDSEIYAAVALLLGGQISSLAIYDPTNVGNSVQVRFR
jgi:hypothetical protein